MIKKTITYTDYNGVQRTEDFYFNLSKPDLVELDVEYPEGFAEKIKNVMETNDKKEMVRIFKDLIMRSYGVKDADGRHFKKSKELSEEFVETPAYGELFMEIGYDSKAAADFLNGLIPSDLQNATQNLAAPMA